MDSEKRLASICEISATHVADKGECIRLLTMLILKRRELTTRDV